MLQGKKELFQLTLLSQNSISWENLWNFLTESPTQSCSRPLRVATEFGEFSACLGTGYKTLQAPVPLLDRQNFPLPLPQPHLVHNLCFR